MNEDEEYGAGGPALADETEETPVETDWYAEGEPVEDAPQEEAPEAAFDATAEPDAPPTETEYRLPVLPDVPGLELTEDEAAVFESLGLTGEVGRVIANVVARGLSRHDTFQQFGNAQMQQAQAQYPGFFNDPVFGQVARGSYARLPAEQRAQQYAPHLLIGTTLMERAAAVGWPQATAEAAKAFGNPAAAGRPANPPRPLPPAQRVPSPGSASAAAAGTATTPRSPRGAEEKLAALLGTSVRTARAALEE